MTPRSALNPGLMGAPNRVVYRVGVRLRTARARHDRGKPDAVDWPLPSRALVAHTIMRHVARQLRPLAIRSPSLLEVLPSVVHLVPISVPPRAARSWSVSWTGVLAPASLADSLLLPDGSACGEGLLCRTAPIVASRPLAGRAAGPPGPRLTSDSVALVALPRAAAPSAYARREPTGRVRRRCPDRSGGGRHRGSDRDRPRQGLARPR